MIACTAGIRNDRRGARVVAAVASAGVIAGALALIGDGPRATAQPAARDQRDAEVLYDSDRREMIVAWSEDLGAGNRVLAKRLRSNGLPVGGPSGGAYELTGVTGAAGAKGDQRWPALASGLLVWSERPPGGADYDLYAQRLRGNGRAVGGPRLIAGGPGDQAYADVVAGRDGTWLVVWSEDTRDAGDVVGLRLSAALTPRGTAFDVARGPGTAQDPTVAPDPSDPSYLLVLWTDDRDGNLNIYGTRIAATGIPRGSPTTAHAAVIDGPEDDYAPVLLVGAAGDRESRGLLQWTRDSVVDGPDVLAQRIRSNGFVVGAAFEVAAGAGIQAWPAATYVDSPLSAAPHSTPVGPDLVRPGSWFSVWSADPLGTLDVYGAEIALNGSMRGRPSPVAAD